MTVVVPSPITGLCDGANDPASPCAMALLSDCKLDAKSTSAELDTDGKMISVMAAMSKNLQSHAKKT